MAHLVFTCTVAGAGVASHLCYFNRGEHHVHGARYIRIFLVLYATAIAVVVNAGGAPICQAFAKISSLAACYFIGLYASLLAYRLLFSPLNKFPGPFGARVSSLWFSTYLKKQDAYKKLLKLHGEHGDFLRIGSNDLSIVHPQAVTAIYGLGSKCRKAAWYDLTQPMVSMQTTRHRATHDKRCRNWSKAFSDKALRGYEERIKVFQDKLLSQIAAFGGQGLNVSKWFNLYSFDVMGDLAFGTSFEMLESSEEHWAIKLLNRGIEPLGYMFPVWFFRTMITIPRIADDWWRFIRYCSQKLDERMNANASHTDIMSALLEPWKGTKPTEDDLRMLRGDSQLIVVAGSDTTAATLTHIFYELAGNPEHILKLREEVAPHIDSSGNILHQNIQYLDHLNGVIFETLRLHPPVPTALQRLTPPEGLEIGNKYIAGNMTVWCPQYVIGRSEKIYTNAGVFVPQRWYSRPEMIKERSAFAPFSAGVYGCIGRPLALLNIRTTLIKLLLKFDIGFAPGDTGAGIEDTSREHFTLAPGDLNIVFKSR